MTKKTPQKKTKALAPVDAFRQDLDKMKPQLKSALPAHIPPEKFTRVVMTVMQTKPELLKLERRSVFAACMLAAQDGLIPDGREAALVPFKGKAQYIPMTAGILKTVRNSGELASLSANVVFQNDEFEYWVDETGEHLKHRPNLDDPGHRRLVYSIARTRDGATYITVMTAKDVEKVRRVSRAKDSGPWKDWPEEMWKKTAIRRLAKILPKSSDLDQVLHRDDDLYDLEGGAESPAPERPPEEKNKPQGLKAAMGIKKEEEEAEDAEWTDVTEDEPPPPSDQDAPYEEVADQDVPI